MVGRHIALIVGIAILLPLLVFYGVSTFGSAPKFTDFNTVTPYNPNMTAEERAASTEKQKTAQASFQEAQSLFAKRLFIVSILVGYAALLIGGFTALSALGTGLIFGGIVSISQGSWFYWSYITDWERFASLLVTGIILVVVALRKVSVPGEGTKRRP